MRCVGWIKSDTAPTPNEPLILNLILILNPTKPKPKLYDLKKALGPVTQLGLGLAHWGWGIGNGEGVEDSQFSEILRGFAWEKLLDGKPCHPATFSHMNLLTISDI